MSNRSSESRFQFARAIRQLVKFCTSHDAQVISRRRTIGVLYQWLSSAEVDRLEQLDERVWKLAMKSDLGIAFPATDATNEFGLTCVPVVFEDHSFGRVMAIASTRAWRSRIRCLEDLAKYQRRVYSDNDRQAIDRMRAQIARQGNNASPKLLISTARIRAQVGRKALRELFNRGEYTGYKR